MCNEWPHVAAEYNVLIIKTLTYSGARSNSEVELPIYLSARCTESFEYGRDRIAQSCVLGTVETRHAL